MRQISKQWTEEERKNVALAHLVQIRDPQVGDPVSVRDHAQAAIYLLTMDGSFLNVNRKTILEGVEYE